LCDALFDIKILNGTFAYIECQKAQALYRGNQSDHGDNDENKYKIYMDKLEDRSCTFTDITIRNPIVKTISGYDYIIHTDGDTVSMKCMSFQTLPRRVISNSKNSYMVTHFDSKCLTLFAGHVWQPTFICKSDEIINICNKQ